MKLFKKALPAALFASLGLGAAGQASADVYGLTYLNVENLSISITGAIGGGAGNYTFQTNADAALNGLTSSGGFVQCNQSTCVNGSPVLSGAVQNAPGSAVNRIENDSATVFGPTGTSYSNAESQIITSELTSGLVDTTHTQQIAESNLAGSGTSAGASTSVQSGTSLNLTFQIGSSGSFSITFDADINMIAQLTGGDTGLSTVTSGLSITLNKQGENDAVVDWSPDNNANVDECAAGYSCSATNSNNVDLNLTRISSGGAASTQTGSSTYTLTVRGLTSGTYNLGLGASNETSLTRETPVPVPGTLLLMGAGLLAGARALRRNK